MCKLLSVSWIYAKILKTLLCEKSILFHNLKGICSVREWIQNGRRKIHKEFFYGYVEWVRVRGELCKEHQCWARSRVDNLILLYAIIKAIHPESWNRMWNDFGREKFDATAAPGDVGQHAVAVFSRDGSAALPHGAAAGSQDGEGRGLSYGFLYGNSAPGSTAPHGLHGLRQFSVLHIQRRLPLRRLSPGYCRSLRYRSRGFPQEKGRIT